jgi:hypothetical protein
VRWGFYTWVAAGAALLGLKALVDLSARQHADVAVRTATFVYHLPAAIVTNAGGWRTDLRRLAGCWDARHTGFVAGLSGVAGCAAPHPLLLDVSRLHEPPVQLTAHAVDVVFWTRYDPPMSHMQVLSAMVGRVETRYADRWQLHRIDEPGTPWVYLLTREPRSRADVADAYAGRCYRADVGSDIGMTCSLVERLPGGAALAFSLGPEGVAVMPAIRAEVSGLVRGWSGPHQASVN